MEKTNETLGREKKNKQAHTAMIKHHRKPEPSYGKMQLKRENGKNKNKKTSTFSICCHHNGILPCYESSYYCQTEMKCL